MSNKRVPIHKRWPGKYAIRATIYTPAGNCLQVETDLTEEDGESVMMTLTRAVGTPEEEEEEEEEETADES